MARNKNQDQAPVAEGEAEAVSTNNVLKWDTYELDLNTVPQSTVIALAQRGFTHVMGNEVASAISAMKKVTVKAEDGTESLKYSEADLEAAEVSKRDAKIAAMRDGTLGVRAPGAPRVVGIDKYMHDIALEELRAIAAAKKMALPRKSEELAPFIAKRLATHGDRIRAAAQAKMDSLAALAGEEI